MKNKSILSFLFVVILSGCGSDVVTGALKGVGLPKSKVWIEQVSFKASEDMNDDAPVTVNLVVIYKPELLAEIVKMDASAFFEKIDQLKIDNAGQLDVFSWDVISGQTLNDQPVNMSKMSGEGAVIFARYSTPGPHRAVLDEQSSVTVKLDKDDFQIVATKAQ